MYYAAINEVWGEPKNMKPKAPQAKPLEISAPPAQPWYEPTPKSPSVSKAIERLYEVGGFESVLDVLPEKFVDQIKENLAKPRKITIELNMATLLNVVMYVLIFLVLYDVVDKVWK